MKKYAVTITTSIAVVLSLLWLFSLIWSIQDFYYGSPEVLEQSREPEIENTPEELTVLALGDSLTRGTGDQSGKGYIGLVTEQLKEQLSLQKVNVYNLGINGQSSTDLLQQLQQPNTRRQIETADVILMTIGGNDLFQQGETLRDFNAENIQNLQQQYLANLQQIFTTIREHNEGVKVFILGLYNPFIELEYSDMTNSIVRQWNYATETVTGKFHEIVFVPTFDLFQLSMNDYLYSDHFHPNQAGYELIANRVASLINWEKEVESNE